MTTNNDNKDNTINVATVAAIAPAPAPSLDETPRYRGAFARMLVAIRALTSDRYVPVNLDVMSSVRTTEGVLPKIASYREVIAQQLPQFDIRLFDELEDRALALGHAHTVFEGTQQAPPLSPELVEEASHLYDVGHSEVTTMVHRKLIAPQALSSLNGGNGYRNLAADLFKLSESLRSNWGKISGRTSMTLAELDRMENVADQINAALGIREQIPELHATAARDRQAAYTLFIEAYDEVRAAIAYVRRNEGDVDSIMPSLYAGRGGGSRKRPTVDEPTQPSPAVTNPNPVATPAPAPVATAVTETHKSAFGAAPPATIGENGPFIK